MKYMMMFYENEAEIAAQRDNAEHTGPYWDAWNAYVNALYTSGVVKERADALQPPAAATTVRLEGGKRLVQDGPVAATKEQLGGYVVIEVADLDAALFLGGALSCGFPRGYRSAPRAASAHHTLSGGRQPSRTRAAGGGERCPHLLWAPSRVCLRGNGGTWPRPKTP